VSGRAKMVIGMRLSKLLVVLGVALGACDSGEAPRRVSVSAVTAPVPPPAPPTPGRPTTFSSDDGASLAGDLYLADNPAAPALVSVHRFGGDRHELDPLIDRLRRAKKRYTLLAFDLRGHGASKLPAMTKSIRAVVRPSVSAERAQAESMTHDVGAAIGHVLEATGGKASGVVLVGSSLGAALISRVAFEQPRVTALALISPGAAIKGVDVYRPYAEVRNLRTFLAAGENDIISREPIDALGRMAMRPTLHLYPSDAHSAGFLGAARQELWSDLEKWLLEVYDEPVTERRSLYFAPGKEPKRRASPGPTAQRPKG
jgi:pimeloyl-ACP methyl ester carboxylesterase